MNRQTLQSSKGLHSSMVQCCCLSCNHEAQGIVQSIKFYHMQKIKALIICSICFLAIIKHSTAQVEKFSTPVTFNDLHMVYTYQKSNWDGSHASTIFLYIRDTNQLQSFKWSKGDTWATLVTAYFDWNNFSVNKLQNHRVDASGKRNWFAELNVDQNRKLRFHVGDFTDSMILDDLHWHSYDFDFASLGFSWRALKGKTGSFNFLIADVGIVNNKPGFENKGRVEVKFQNKEKVDGVECLKYKIDGPGLKNKGGYIWINPVNNMIQFYKIELPDEEGFDNGQLKLLSIQKMTPQAWDQFITEKMIQH